jgi:3-hydroxyacyl-CoA dehydrogenase
MSAVSNWKFIDGIAVLTLDNPPVNAISAAVRTALVEGVTQANANAEVAALVIACAGKTFFAGADLKEFGKPSVPPFLTEVVDVIEASEKPVVAAIHGTALGGGLEIAMGCHYRLATVDAKLGLPEVKLALMPGARGTQHLPRLVGVQHALEIIALGEPVTAKRALEIGLIDELIEHDLLATAVSFARSKVGKPPRRSRDLVAAPVPDALYEAFAGKHARKFRGFDAPPAIIASIRAATELPFTEGAAREREIFLKLREGPQNEAMRHVFFAEREAAKAPGLEGVMPRSLDSVGVIGAGTMGTGIAIALLSAGLAVTLFERDNAALQRGMERISSTFAGNVRAGRIDEAQANAALNALIPTLHMTALAPCDLIIEAAYETMDVKQSIFGALDAIAKPGAVLATNTSYLDVDAIAAVTTRPQDVMGLHFFSPANIMKLLEIVRAGQTAPDVLATALALAKRIGKQPVVAGNAWGFIGNRMLAVRRREAESMVVEGASPQQVDRVLQEFGFAMGPFGMADLAGLDLGWSVEASTGSTIRERLCEAGRRGQKSRAGFYDYDEAMNANISDEADAIISEFARDQGILRRSFSDAEVLDRLLWPMIDEGAKLLAEGVAQRASDIDVVWLHGYGWPRWTGGPMFHARQTGIDEVCRRLETIGVVPSDALRQL